MATAIAQRVQKHRASLRDSGLRPIQIWVPDVRRAGFAEECRRQSLLIAEVEHEDAALSIFMDEALADIEGWQA